MATGNDMHPPMTAVVPGPWDLLILYVSIRVDCFSAPISNYENVTVNFYITMPVVNTVMYSLASLRGVRPIGLLSSVTS